MKNTIKWLLIALLLVGITLGASLLYKKLSKEYDSTTPGTAPSAETQTETALAPDFKVYDASGNTVRLSDFKGKPVVLNFWASWCYYCKEEMPDFETLSKEHPEVQFMMINATDGVQETEESAKEYIEKEQFSFDVFFDTSMQAVFAYNISSFPTTIFIDADGNLVGGVSGMMNYDSILNGINAITK